uniref:Uncharacterized protein n=1 Tax=Setaria viridis TaxID=4556 RepID=A0A4U6WF52_SETVI|nr:hypothetical protein SEVIR_1G319000v2 [Setaria viridis]
MSRFVLPLMMALMMLLAVLGSARRIEGEKWTGGEAATSGEHPTIQFAKHMYLQKTPGASSSCTTGSPNNPSCHHP